MLKFKAVRYFWSLRGLISQHIYVKHFIQTQQTSRNISCFYAAVKKSQNDRSLRQNSSRFCSSDSGDSDEQSKPTCPRLLMAFEPVLRPEVFLSIRNWIMIKLIIKPYLDSEFVLKDFIAGTKQALVTASEFLSKGDFQSLKGLVSDEVLPEIEKSYSLMNVKERQDLHVNFSDVLFTFPYQIGIMFDDDSQKRFCEVTVVYHILKGFEDLKESGKLEQRMYGHEDAKDDVTICNYRFIREYTKGVQSSWVINKLGHFRLCHLQN